ncbi:AraC family transcriptional regulator [Paenibacillus sp. P96]|uniref:AraC family transcriptional regulator n=1 Tax=Paenibacillus zeirhizosphaerae TaxID=2987519 RepID=A0ABT9FW67_9BACL|nr:AraC family transcriptional regulator [Paenibacillus sp. P96]MDP4098771.1 AraC family transcriptional regulator [Paenibacillus sp. P96]
MQIHSVDRIKIPKGFWLGLHYLNIAPSDVVRKAGLPLTIVNDQTFITTDQYFALWQAFSDIVEDPAESTIKLSTNFENAQLPPSVMAPYHARDYRDALNRMARYKQLCAPERILIVEEGELCTIELSWLFSERPEPPMLIGVSLASLVELGRRGSGKPLNAHAVVLSRPMGNVQALEAFFGCSVRVGSERSRLILRRSDLDRPFISYNEELLEILTPVLDRSLEQKFSSSSITETVKWILKQNLASGRPDMRVIASELGMSERTLQRRLTDEGTSFKQLLTDTRRESALEYLADPKLDLKEVAFLLGYEDQNSFFRAFRQWEGDTPSHWRAEHLDANVTTDGTGITTIH